MKAPVLTTDEETVMRMTFKAALLRAADIIKKITADDVLEMQAKLLREGARLEDVAKIDRAMLAEVHLRECAEGKVK